MNTAEGAYNVTAFMPRFLISHSAAAADMLILRRQRFRFHCSLP